MRFDTWASGRLSGRYSQESSEVSRGAREQSHPRRAFPYWKPSCSSLVLVSKCPITQNGRAPLCCLVDRVYALKSRDVRAIAQLLRSASSRASIRVDDASRALFRHPTDLAPRQTIGCNPTHTLGAVGPGAETAFDPCARWAGSVRARWSSTPPLGVAPRLALQTQRAPAVLAQRGLSHMSPRYQRDEMVRIGRPSDVGQTGLAMATFVLCIRAIAEDVCVLSPSAMRLRRLVSRDSDRAPRRYSARMVSVSGLFLFHIHVAPPGSSRL